jgi:hypothetical protein
MGFVLPSILRIDHLVHSVRLARDDEVEGGWAPLGPFPNCGDQPAGCRRLMGDDEDMGRLGHDSPPAFDSDRVVAHYPTRTTLANHALHPVQMR